MAKKRNIRFFHSEHDEQKALFGWALLNRHVFPELDLMFAIPNGGLRNIIVAKKLRLEGVKRGVPDIFLPVARCGFHGLFIELKKIGGKISSHQRQWIDNISMQGYLSVVCYGWVDASNIIEKYIRGQIDKRE